MLTSGRACDGITRDGSDSVELEPPSKIQSLARAAGTHRLGEIHPLAEFVDPAVLIADVGTAEKSGFYPVCTSSLETLAGQWGCKDSKAAAAAYMQTLDFKHGYPSCAAWKAGGWPTADWAAEHGACWGANGEATPPWERCSEIVGEPCACP